MPAETLDDLQEAFALFDNWEERYRYLIELGQGMMPMAPELKTSDAVVKGCTSKVWLDAQDRAGKWHFIGDSDSTIVRGLIAVLLMAYQDRTVDEIKAVDIEAAFGKLGLEDHLSPNRRSGFFAMVERIRSVGT